MQTGRLIIEYLAECQSRHLAERTIEKYRWALAQLPPRYPTADELREILGRTDRRVETLRTWHRSWSAFFRWCSIEHELENPLSRVRPPRAERLLPEPYSQYEIDQLWRACRTDRDRALIRVALDTGCRLGEIASIRPESILDELDGFRLVVSGKTGPRIVPVSDETVELLRHVSGRDYVWVSERDGRRMTASGLVQSWKRIVRRAGIRREARSDLPPGIRRRRGPQNMRLTYAVSLIRRNVSLRYVQELLGHRDIRTTQGYTPLAASDLARIHRQFSPAHRLGGGV